MDGFKRLLAILALMLVIVAFAAPAMAQSYGERMMQSYGGRMMQPYGGYQGGQQYVQQYAQQQPQQNAACTGATGRPGWHERV